jgi:hypothetical protein
MPAECAPVNEKRPASRHLEFTAIKTEWAGDAGKVPGRSGKVQTTRDVPPDMFAVEAEGLAAIAASGAMAAPQASGARTRAAHCVHVVRVTVADDDVRIPDVEPVIGRRVCRVSGVALAWACMLRP